MKSISWFRNDSIMKKTSNALVDRIEIVNWWRADVKNQFLCWEMKFNFIELISGWEINRFLGNWSFSVHLDRIVSNWWIREQKANIGFWFSRYRVKSIFCDVLLGAITSGSPCRERSGLLIEIWFVLQISSEGLVPIICVFFLIQ